MASLFIALAELTLIISAAYGISSFILKKENWHFTQEYIVYRILLGLGIISYLTFLAAALRFLNLSFFCAIVAAGNLFFLRELKVSGPIRINLKFSSWMLLLLPFVLVNLFYALFPPTFYDSMLYHLAVPAFYINHNGLAPWLTNFNSNLPLNGEMLFLFGLLGKTTFIPNLMIFLSGLGLLVLLYSMSKDYVSHSWLALVLFYTIPEVSFLTSISKPDILGMLYLLAALRLFHLFQQNPGERKLLVLSGLFWGLAITTKYTFAFILCGFFVSFFLFVPGRLQKKIITIASLAMIVFLCLIPWFIKNTIITGNPTYPYLSDIFKNPYWDKTQSASFANALQPGMSGSIVQSLWFPIDAFLKPFKYGMIEVLGTLYLIFLPFIFFSKKFINRGFWIGTAIFSMILMVFYARVPRYFLPIYLVLSIPIASGIERVASRWQQSKKLILTLLIVLLGFNLMQLVNLQEMYTKGISFARKKISGPPENTDVKYLYCLPYYRAAEFINRTLGARDKIAFLGEERTFYVQKEFAASSFNDHNLIIDVLKNTENFIGFNHELLAAGITHILYCPTGMVGMAEKCHLYRLSTVQSSQLDDYLNRFPLIYRDRFYSIYQVRE